MFLPSTGSVYSTMKRFVNDTMQFLLLLTLFYGGVLEAAFGAQTEDETVGQEL